MTNLKQMIADQQALLAARRETFDAYRAADEAYLLGSKALTDALVEASGRKPGDVIKTTDGVEGKIYAFRRSDTGDLIATCYGKTKAGKWSARIKFSVKLSVKIEEQPTGSYFAKDGTLMNADGTRSIFDDVDK